MNDIAKIGNWYRSNTKLVDSFLNQKKQPHFHELSLSNDNPNKTIGIDLTTDEFKAMDYYGINLALLAMLNGKPIKYSLKTRLWWKWRSFKRLFQCRRYAKIN